MPAPRRPRAQPPQPSLLEPEGIPNLDEDVPATAPLAARMRPRDFDDYLGQEHLVGPGKLLRRLVEAGQLPSIILWGPPGSGKTTLARIIAGQTAAHFVGISAVSAGVADIRRVMAEARARQTAPTPQAEPWGIEAQTSAHPEALEGRVQPSPDTAMPRVPTRGNTRTILFIDEIHRFNKAQQDAVLPYVEDGTVTLIGATTENPSFEVIGPLLSRSRVFTLKALAEADLARLIQRALTDPDRGLGALNVDMEPDAIEALAASVGGDARIALNALEAAVLSVEPSVRSEEELSSRHPEPVEGPALSPSKGRAPASAHPEVLEGRVQPASEGAPTGHASPEPRRRVTRAVIEEALQHRTYLYDRQGDAHYDTISAFIKSLRGSDPDASLYWLARMVEAGEDPLFIVRRMVILAAEDIGLADPQALVVATACQQAVHFIGMPEGFLPLAETTLYLALAPKSNSALTAYGRALADVEATRNDPVPLHLRNAATGLMQQLGYGRGYQYAHDYAGGIAPDQTYLPDRLRGHRYYEPKGTGEDTKGTGED